MLYFYVIFKNKYAHGVHSILGSKVHVDQYLYDKYILYLVLKVPIKGDISTPL